MVWRRDPVPALSEAAAAGADIQAMYHGPNGRFEPMYANSGFMYFQNSVSVRDFWEEVCSRHDMVGYFRSQQEPLNVLLAAHAQRSLHVVVLDEERFANGHLYCGGRTPPADPWVVHRNRACQTAVAGPGVNGAGRGAQSRLLYGRSPLIVTRRSILLSG